jgi:sporulation protein YlmC with PRC-barrel domain
MRGAARSVPMYVTDLRGLRIFSLMSALRMGSVADALLDPSCRHVAALVVREYGPGARRLVPRQLVRHVGRNAVILAGNDELHESTQLEHADRLINLATFVGLEVVTDYGNLLGRIHNATIDPDTLEMEEYEVEGPGRLLGQRRTRRIKAHESLSASKDVLIVPESVLSETAQPAHAAVGESQQRPWVAPGMLDGSDEAGAATMSRG